MKVEKLKIEGMSCQHCIMALRKELSKLDLRIKEIQIGSAEIEYDEFKVSSADIKEAINKAGFKLLD